MHDDAASGATVPVYVAASTVRSDWPEHRRTLRAARLQLRFLLRRASGTPRLVGARSEAANRLHVLELRERSRGDMFRLTHVEADDVELIADGHRIVCRAHGARDCGSASQSRAGTTWPESASTPPMSALRLTLAWVVDAAVLLIAAAIGFIVRVLGVLCGGLVIPLLHELGCIVGSAVLCGAGWVGRHLADEASKAGVALYSRSFVLAAGTHVIARLSVVVHRPATRAAGLLPGMKE